jgi:hypothetical protein
VKQGVILTMRSTATLTSAVLALGLAATSASAQIYVTSITASFPDPNGKVPVLDGVPGAGVDNWAMGLAQGVLTHGQTYNYCVSLASATADGNVELDFKIKRGSTDIQGGTILAYKDFKVGSGGVWYECAGYHTLPDSPGPATLNATAYYKAHGTTKPVVSVLNVPVLLQ